MTEPTVIGKSYWEIVVHAFRKNTSARVALWVSMAMVVVSALTPVLANDRPFCFKGTLPGEYRRSFNQVSRGGYMQLVSLPARLREETEKFEQSKATQTEFLKRVTNEDARRIYETLQRLRKRAEALPAIRGRWVSGDVTIAEMKAEMTPAEAGPFDEIRQRIIRDLPSAYEERLSETLQGIVVKFRELGDQLEPSLTSKAAELEVRFRAITAGAYLTSKDDQKAALKGVVEELRASFDPDKVVLIPKWRFPLIVSLGGLDVFFILATVFALAVFGPLTWWKLRSLKPLERRWRISWGLILVPALALSLLWEAAHDVKFQTVSYKKGAQDGSVILISSVWPLVRYRYDEVPEITVTDERQRPPTPPEGAHLCGTDFMGRDLLSRMLWGSRVSLSIGFVSSIIAVAIGIFLGALAGYYGHWVDMGLSRLVEIMICFPSFFIILAVVAFLPPSILYVMLVLGIFGWMGIARLQRGEFYRLMGQDFVVAARALGASNSRVIFRHVLPNALAPVLVAASFGIAGAMLTESGLSFLGFGVQEPATSWGQILFTGRGQLDKWWTFVIPGAAIFVAVTCYNLVGDGIRDAVDPRLKT